MSTDGQIDMSKDRQIDMNKDRQIDMNKDRKIEISKDRQIINRQSNYQCFMFANHFHQKNQIFQGSNFNRTPVQFIIFYKKKQ